MLDAAEAILTNPAHPAWPRVWGECLDRGFGKPTQPISNAEDKPFVVFAQMPAAASSTDAWQAQAKRQLR